MLRHYQATIDAAGFQSAPVGRLTPVVDPHRSAGTFVEQDRPDFVFFDMTAVASVLRAQPHYSYYGLGVFEAADDAGTAAYCGTLMVDVSTDALGAFVVEFRTGPSESFLLTGTGDVIEPRDFEPLIISVPPAGCGGGPDCNGNGIADACDLTIGGSSDCNANDVPDECDVAKGGASDDCTGNGVPDECEPDCNENGAADSCDIAAGRSDDCNGNDMPDECEDCNGNGVADECDIAAGWSMDCNGNSVPDECDLAAQASADCTNNSIPDECEPDCNGNGVADSCDILGGSSIDGEWNGIPDECQSVLRVPENYLTIQAAIDSASPGDTVLIADGIYSGVGNRSLDFGGRVLTVRSENGPGNCIIDVGDDVPGVQFRSGESSLAVLEGLTITNGSGIECDASSPVIRNCVIDGNRGSGIACLNGSRAVIINSIITSNTAPVGGGIYCYYSSPTIRNCTVVGNTATFFGGGVYADSSHPVIRMCIFRENTALMGAEIDLRFNSSAEVLYSNVQGGAAGVNVIYSTLVWGAGNGTWDPAFGGSDVGGYGLTPRSRCINAGDAGLVPSPGETDIDGQPRILFGIVDIGADEADVFEDCNVNGVPDWMDITAGTGADCNNNGIPDECDPDCNMNGVADECDLAEGTSHDCNRNGLPDECDAESFVIMASDPPDEAIDARQPSEMDGTGPDGWKSVVLTFDGDVSALTGGDFSITQEGGETPAPGIRAVSVEGENRIEVLLTEAIEPGAWTTIRYECNGSSVRLGYLPGDVNQDGISTTDDVAALVYGLEDIGSGSIWASDLDRSGRLTARDILRAVDLLNGGAEFEAWRGRSLP